VRRAVSWPFVGPPVALLIAFGEIGARIAPPATDVSTWCFGAAAVLLTLKLLLWITASHHTFGRHDRLAAFVMLCAIATGWYVSRQWIRERQFDYVVAAQNAELRLSVAQLAAEILAFAAERDRHAPPPPRPATWDQDEAAIARYRIEMVTAYEHQFGKQVRTAHDIFNLLGMSDKELEIFYAHPANASQMRIIAVKLASLAARVRA
jgi:hypothetical protein